MNDMKKLIKRDKFIWLLWSIAVTVFVGNVLFAFYKNAEESFVQLYKWKAERPELFELVSFSEDYFWIDSVKYVVGNVLVWVLTIGIIVFQDIKWFVREKRGGSEFQKLLPVKEKHVFIYELAVGILAILVPIVLFWCGCQMLLAMWNQNHADVLVFIQCDPLRLPITTWGIWIPFLINGILVYTLYLFTKYATNHLAGHTFTFGMFMLSGFWVYATVPLDIGRVNLRPWIGLAGIVICVVLAYICNQKRDLSASGFFAFRSVQYVTMLLVFINLIIIFWETGSAYHMVVRVLYTAGLSIFITVGANYVMKPKY
ncbi:MAG: hypothetical protein IJZ44_09905 [Lachnospiraceae bacterium]|nr:hypothetical protein [Lachnospiraceae bacterium]